eukprot:TRINITY_DN2452_c0_g1_i1.p4 TRINITY_DN2452_c0_g1~~TRINITY_DN2452_c0_g1_i1.p4  ORF type:complete len:188 (+),score=28.13 TRINITY_DN2452_c0_g1_i1:1563-2126(+)
MIAVTDKDKEVISIPGAKGWTREGTEFSDEIPLVKARYTFKNDIDPNRFMELLTEKRKEWDNAILDYENLRKERDWTIYRYILKAPAFFMKPMDFVEKRILFEENGTFYGYYTYVPEDIFPPQEKYDRCHTVFGGTILRKEGNEYVYYSLSQFDPHMNTTVQKLMMSFVPAKVKAFYKDFQNALYNL